MVENYPQDFAEIEEDTVNAWHVTQTLDAPDKYGSLYLQKLTTYFQVTVSCENEEKLKL